MTACVLSGMAPTRLSACDIFLTQSGGQCVPGFSVFDTGVVAVPVGV